MKYIVEFDGDSDIDGHEFHASSHDKLKRVVKEWMEGDGRFTQGDVYTDAGRFICTIFL